MDNQLLYKLVEEVRQQGRFAQFAFQNVRTSVSGLDSERIFFYVHAFVAHLGNIERLLWPVRPESRTRGDQLRSELKVDENSSLRLTHFRRHLDQFDESLEDWASAIENRNYVDMNIMPRGTIANYRQDAFQRDLDPDRFQFWFRGDPFDLRGLADELRKLDSAAESWLKTHRPW
jgi:hypothetical protein